MSRSNPGDLVVICVEQHAAIMAELESFGHHAQPGARRQDERDINNAVPDPTRTARPDSAETGWRAAVLDERGADASSSAKRVRRQRLPGASLSERSEQ